MSNHSKQKSRKIINEHDNQKGAQTESVADLELSSEQAEEIQAGASSIYPGFSGGVRVAATDLD